MAVANEQIGAQAREDLALAELLAFPLLALLTVLIFRGAAALLPLAVGLVSVFGAFTVLRGVNAATPSRPRRSRRCRASAARSSRSSPRTMRARDAPRAVRAPRPPPREGAPEASARGRVVSLRPYVMRRPGLVALTTAAALLLVALPALRTQWTGIDASILPTSKSARVVQDRLEPGVSGTARTAAFAAVVSAPPGAAPRSRLRQPAGRPARDRERRSARPGRARRPGSSARRAREPMPSPPRARRSRRSERSLRRSRAWPVGGRQRTSTDQLARLTTAPLAFALLIRVTDARCCGS